MSRKNMFENQTPEQMVVISELEAVQGTPDCPQCGGKGHCDYAMAMINFLIGARSTAQVNPSNCVRSATVDSIAAKYPSS